MSRRPTRDHHFCLRGRDVPPVPVSPVPGTSRGGERGRLRREREQFIILQRQSSSSSDDNSLIESPRKKKKVFIPQEDLEMAVQGMGQQIAELGQIFQQNNVEVQRQNELFNQARREVVEQLDVIVGRMEAVRDQEIPPAQAREEGEVVDENQGMLRNNNALIGRLLPDKYSGRENEDPKDFIAQCDTTATQYYGEDVDRFCGIFPSLLKKTAHLWYVTNNMLEVHNWERMKTRFLQRFDSITISEKVEMKTKKMKEGQTIAHFIEDFEYRIHRAGVQNEDDIMGLFFQGILPFYRSKLMAENLLNVQQVYARAREMETELQGIKEYTGVDQDKTLKAVTELLAQVKKMNEAPPPEKETVKPAVAVIEEVNMIQQQPPKQQQIPQQYNKVNQNKDGQQNPERETRSCHYCGKVGHIQTSCFKKQREQQGGQQKGYNNQPRGPPRRYGQGNPGRGQNQPRQNNYNNPRNSNMDGVKCYQCNKFGHMARDCYNNGGARAPTMQYFQQPGQTPQTAQAPAQVFGTFQVDNNGLPIGYAAVGNAGQGMSAPQGAAMNHPNQ